MDEARALVEKGMLDESVVVAARQTQGRGRRGRKWDSLPGNLFMTYIYRHDCPLSIAPQLSFVACVSVGEALRSFIPPGNTITYKWPNDVLLNGKKVAGILLETIELSGQEENAYLIACGLNITDFPKDVRYPATSLQEESILLAYEEILNSIVISLQKHLMAWSEQGFSSIYTLWMRDAAYIDASVTIDLQGKIQSGIFKGLDKDGAMLLKTSDGLMTINAGEVLAGGTHAFSN